VNIQAFVEEPFRFHVNVPEVDGDWSSFLLAAPLQPALGTFKKYLSHHPLVYSLPNSRGMFLSFRTSAPVVAADELCESSVHSAPSDSTEGVIDLKGDNKLQDASALHNLNLNYTDLWALALCTSIGGHYLGWSVGLSAGFGTFMTATVLMASGFVCLLCCISELASAIPFAGKYSLPDPFVVCF
jgi:hypothetical protein